MENNTQHVKGMLKNLSTILYLSMTNNRAIDGQVLHVHAFKRHASCTFEYKTNKNVSPNFIY